MSVMAMYDWFAEDKHPWGTKPSGSVKQALPHLQGHEVLELGVGDGRNAVFLAQNGFKILGVDLLQSGLDSLMDWAKINKVLEMITPVLSDITEYNWSRLYENIIATYTLHFLPRSDFYNTIRHMKAYTKPGGINLISDMTQDGDMYEDRPDYYFLQPNELKKLYSDWEIISYEEVKTPTKGTDKQGKQGWQTAAHLIAKRPLAERKTK